MLSFLVTHITHTTSPVEVGDPTGTPPKKQMVDLSSFGSVAIFVQPNGDALKSATIKGLSINNVNVQRGRGPAKTNFSKKGGGGSLKC